MAEDKIFANGFSFKRRENAPDFVVGRVKVKVDDAIAFLKEKQKNGWVDIDVKQAKSGSYYMELDTWEPNKGGGKAAPSEASGQDDDDDIPF